MEDDDNSPNINNDINEQDIEDMNVNNEGFDKPIPIYKIENAVDAITEFVNHCKEDNNNFSEFNHNIIALFCCLSCMNFQDKCKNEHRYSAVYNNYINCVENFHMKDWCTVLLNALRKDGKRELPAEIKEALLSYIDKGGEDIVSKGEKIWKNYTSCIKEITSNVNQHWKEVLPSGQNEAGLLYGIAERLWEVKKMELATNAFDSKINSARKATKPSQATIDFINEHTIVTSDGKERINKAKKKEWIVKQYTLTMNQKPQPRSWRPKYWLAFLCLGKPGYILGDKPLPEFCGGRVTSGPRLVPFDSSQMTKKVRRIAQQNIIENNSKSNVPKMETSTNVVTHVHTTEIDDHSKYINELKEEISLMESLKMDECEIREIKLKLLEALRSNRKSLEANLLNQTQSSNYTTPVNNTITCYSCKKELINEAEVIDGFTYCTNCYVTGKG